MKNKFSIALSLAVIMSMLLTSIGFADTISSDVDFVTTANQTLVNLGIVAPGQVVHSSTSFQLVCAGSNHADLNNIVTVQYQSATIPSDGALTVSNATIGPIPSDWADDVNGNSNCGQATLTVLNDNDDSAVDITAPTTAGTHDFVVKYTAANTGGIDSNDVTGSIPAVTFRLTVVANTAPSVSVTGVTNGATYNKGAIPAAMCQVADTEDGPSSFAATLSAVTGTYASDGIGSQTASCSYTDKGGITASASATYSIVDGSAPSINYVLNPVGPDGNSGWYKSSVTLTWTVTENESPNSLVKTGCDDQNITLDQPATDYSCSATSAGGSDGPVTVNIKRDATAPMITGSRSPDANAGWNNGDVKVAFSCNDAMSGLASCTPEVTVSTEGANQSVPGTAVDNAGNEATTTVSGINIDKTKPTISASVSAGTNGLNGWYTSDVTVHFTCSDLGSGIPYGACPADQVLNTEGAEVASTAMTVTDAAGNTSEVSNVVRVKIDKTAPTATLAVTAGTPGLNGWYTSDVTVSTSGVDAVSGVTCTAAQSQTDETAGEEFNGSCTNGAGLSTDAAPLTIKLDKTGPSASLAVSAGTPGLNGWYTSDVTVSASGTDLISSPVSCTGDQYLTTDSTGTEFNGSCTNDAGLTTNAAPLIVKRDATAPTVISFVGGPAAGGSYYFGSVPAAPTCTADGAISGLASCVVTGYGTTVGSKTLTATATDNAGNVGTATQSYTVLAWTLKGFYQPVDMNGVLNTVKNGSTVPLKFEVFAGSTELTNIDIISAFTQKISCTAGLGDDIEQYATGGTSLRYDTTGGQFIFNWQTPKTPGACYRVTMTTLDGSSITADFKLK